MATPPDERSALLVLNALPDIGPIAVRRLRDHFREEEEPARAALAASPEELRRVRGIGPEAAQTIARWGDQFDPGAELERAARLGVTVQTVADPDYPALLAQLPDPPPVLYRLGPVRPGPGAVAVVGTRRPSQYGRGLARLFARELARHGVTVVSGMARGIDTEAHLGALEAGGPTVAVLGCGVDLVYPPENGDLYRQLAREGLLCSEFPLGHRAGKTTFPRRNRLIAGLCQAVLVVESDLTGGSIITAKFAGDYGRGLFALPGRVDNPAARGCHQLIRDGATLVTSPEELLEDLRCPLLPLAFDGGEGAAGPGRPDLSSEERALYDQLEAGAALHPDQMAAGAELPSAAVSAALLLLEIKGLVGRNPDGTYERR